MGLILLEALAALGLLLFLVWWTMFSGRDKDRDQDQSRGGDAPPDPGPGAAPSQPASRDQADRG